MLDKNLGNKVDIRTKEINKVPTMCVINVKNRNVLKKTVFLPELSTTISLIAVPESYRLRYAYRLVHRWPYTRIKNSCKYYIFLVSESRVLDYKLLSTLSKALMYKDKFFINKVLTSSCMENLFEFNLLTSNFTHRLHSQSVLKSNPKLNRKDIFYPSLKHYLLNVACSALWIYYRSCITYIFLMLKSDNNSDIAYIPRNVCICTIEDDSRNKELQEFKIFAVNQVKHIQNYYNFQNTLFQSLTHGRQNVYLQTTSEINSTTVSQNLHRDGISWDLLWECYQIFFNSIPFTGRNFPKKADLTYKKPQNGFTDYVKYSASNIRSILKGTLYYDNVTDSDDEFDEFDISEVDEFDIGEVDENDTSSAVYSEKSLYNNVEIHKDLKKYWIKRYRLFSKFDEGIKLDYESWFSVTPEKIAIHTAEKCKCDVIIDAFCGAGGNSIQFANTCQQVLAIDIDPQKIRMARHNAKIYGVDSKIDFIIGNFFCLAGDLIGDVVFLSPPWGGPTYVKKDVFELEHIMEPHGGEKLLKTAQKISRNIAYYLPKNINTSQLLKAAGSETKVEVEKNFLNDQVVAVTAYYGKLINKQ